MQFSYALNPRRIARSLVTVLVITLVQSVVPVVVSPIVSAPKAEAVTATVVPSSSASGSTFTVPTGVFSIAFEVMGGAGGKGGDDVNIGKSGTVAGRVFATFAVTPGDVIGLYPGKAGTAGIGGGSGTAGGVGGTDTFPDGAYSINGTYFQSVSFNGGAGGTPGTFGASGSGGGAGAASVVTINSEIVIIAGGAGGGGGTGSGSNTASDWNGTLSPNGTNFSGTTGTNAPVGTCGGGSNNDGGGGGGGGGGYYGGNGGTSAIVSNECAGTSGSPGGNYLASRATTVTNDRTAFTNEGSTKYTYDAEPLAPCAKTTSAVDIYTVERVSYVGNCTWTVPSTVNVIDLFLVGGGGGGGGDGGSGGGGGAGLLRTAIGVTPSTNLTLKAGYGGAGGSWAYSWNPIAGEATTLTLASGTVFTANGGSGGTPGPGSGAGAGGTAVNGGFAGGAGGTSPACFNVGGAGKTGVSNYFLGTINTYGGGGGGGACPNGSATTAAAGANGGGAGGYAISGSLNAPGSNATPGSGSGGGGGIATGTGLKVNGGKGGSGIILIRYATSSANAFPAALASSVAGRWGVDGLQVLDSGRQGWIDASAAYTAGVVEGSPTVTSTGTMDGANSTGSTKSNLSVAGNTGAKATLVAANIPTYTVFHIARYVTNGTMRRIITAKDNNWLSGHYSSTNYKTAYHNNNWMTPGGTADTKWLLSTDQVRLYRANGSDISYDYGNANIYNSTTTPTGFGINNFSTETSDWQMLDIVAFSRNLTNGEIRLMEAYLARIYGLTLEQEFDRTETDTALNMDGGQYFYTQYGYGTIINDTFTIEAWIKPSATCATQRCMFFSKWASLIVGVYNGVFSYHMYGTNSGWQEVVTTAKIPMNEWHHFAMVKRGVANSNNSVDFYLDGQLMYTKPKGPYTNDVTTDVVFNSADVIRQNDDAWPYVGSYVGDYWRWHGGLDEIKLWKVARTQAEIQSDMHSADPSNPQLQLYYDFNRKVGTSALRVANLGYSGGARSDLIPVGTVTYADVKTTTVNGPYTTINFPRTYLNQIGGWKVPDSVTVASTIVVGGGGGGGYGGVNNRPAGGGGGGGVIASLTQSYTPGATVSVKVGAGGLGGWAADAATVRNGQSSIVGVGSTLTALGGGGGGNNSDTGAGSGVGDTSIATGGGSGESSRTCSGSPATETSGTFVPGGVISSGYNGTGGVWGWGGSGGGARGAATRSDCVNSQVGVPGPGYVDPITNIEYGRGGSAAGYSTTYYIAGNTTQNNGWGGVISYNGASTPGANTSGLGYRGSFGTVVIRYITASKPTFTKPTNAYLNVGMTETFTTNVAQDSATAMLTRTFRWESTTAGSGGTFTPIKTGTGANNAFFSWVPSDTSTSGSQYLYRVVVTDSDTAGLFIVDTSTPVFAVINRTLAMTGTTSIKKQINIARNETFTISHGTPSYRYTLTPTLSGVRLDTSTVGTTILRIADTATIGTFALTLTVTDSVSASVAIPISLVISPPPTLVNTAQIVETGQVFAIDAANSASYNSATGAWSDISGSKRPIAVNASTSLPAYSNDYSGVVSFDPAKYHGLTTSGIGRLENWTIDAWVRIDTALTGERCVVATEYVSTRINYTLCIDQGRTVYTGWYISPNWTYMRTTYVVPLNTWVHLVGVWNGVTTKLYINGTIAPGTEIYTTAGTVTPTADGDKTYFVKWRDSGTPNDANYYSPFSIGSIRLYNLPLTETQVVQNYSATQARFTLANINQLKPSQKYGTITLESFTVTSGGDTETVSFAVGNRAGISWDTTSTPGQAKLTVQETLTPGTYFDTITVTDEYAQSTNLPIRFTVTKADTLTIFIDTPTALNYTGNRALFTPTVKTIGAVGLESGTAISTTVRFKPAGTTCATGGYCRVGDLGPGGGIVFIDTSTTSSDGRIYEVAPQNWSGSDDLSTVGTFCSNNSSTIGSTQIGIGWGETNTNLAKTACLGGAVGRVNTFNSSNSTGYSDWFIPSRNEGIELAKVAATAGLLNIGSNWSTGNWGYWGSTEVNSSTMSSIGHVGPLFNGTSNVLKSESTKNMVRPVRAFRACWAIDTCTALLTTETPTAAGIYMISPTSGASAATLAERYSSIRYVDTRLTINRIAQRAQVIPFLNVNFPDTFTVNVTEGNGDGALTYSATNGTASGCTFDYKKLYSTTQGTCTVTVVKAGDRNYLPDTTTAGMLLLAFVLNQPSAGVGSGPNIALSGQTSVTLDPNVAPTISSLSTYTAQAGVTTLVITGAGFDSANLAGITVKFWRNVVASGFTVNAQNSQITVTVPAGATTGKVTVTTPNGQAVSEFALTITP